MSVQSRQKSANGDPSILHRRAFVAAWWRWGVAMLCFVALGWWSGAALADPSPGMERVLQTVDGKTLRLSDLRGKVVLVNFWATWCPPCLEEIPEFVRFYQKYADKGVVVLGVNFMDHASPEQLTQFIAKHQINYPIIHGDPAHLTAVAQALGGVFGLPVTKLLDQQGRLVASHMGGVNEKEMQHWVEPLLTTASAVK
ncbi:MAG: TlpA family protein disulfide reductase [Magnetococcales bacterium]|nr:TlpA family protein disulfide reductase [Magnetococcales bacterium]